MKVCADGVRFQAAVADDEHRVDFHLLEANNSTSVRAPGAACQATAGNEGRGQ